MMWHDGQQQKIYQKTIQIALIFFEIPLQEKLKRKIVYNNSKLRYLHAINGNCLKENLDSIEECTNLMSRTKIF